MIRERIVSEVSRILHGPISGSGEELNKNPLDFYSVGVLFPQIIQQTEYENQDEDCVGSGVEDGEVDNLNVQARSKTKSFYNDSDDLDKANELELTTKFRPSAAGLSVLVSKKSNISIVIRFARYEKKKTDHTTHDVKEGARKRSVLYKHVPFEFKINVVGDIINCEGLRVDINNGITKITLQDDVVLAIATRQYPYKQDQDALEIKTFTLVNTKSVKTFNNQKTADDCIFQPVILLETEGYFYPFDDRTDLDLLSDEDLNLKLLYRNYKVYAQGHGISVNWKLEGDKVQRVYTEVLPLENVNGVDLNPDIFKDSNVLYIKRLSGSSIESDYNWKIIEKELLEFVDKYKQWIEEQESKIEITITELKLREKARKNIGQCKVLHERMLLGIDILANDKEARKAFEDANRAMFMQRVMADFSRHRRSEGRVQRNDSNFDDPLPEYRLIPFDAPAGKIWKDGRLCFDQDNYEKLGNLARWRPFQLSFLLSQVKGITDPLSDDRDTVDLIWFPTGGGKTEAYLGLTAFTIFYRRLKAKKLYNNPNKGAGVSVLMRYTLRLLNKQQFERACILICSCDLIRRADSDNYGDIRISNGIWMGSSMTPNSEENQQKYYTDYIKKIEQRQEPNSFQSTPPLLSCPCCGNRLVKETDKNNNVIGRWGYFQIKNNKGKSVGRYLIACTNTRCDFYVTQDSFKQNQDMILPVYEVDETIYNERPSLLFSTVDKFVQLAWNSNAFNLFNLAFNDNQVKRLYPAPDLIIQDELHLISSALGTIYGIYEIVVDRLCREVGGNISKVVGATATVRNAEDQCKRLYGRKNFLQFPPPALDADDSFYAKKIKGEDPKNRLYVGFMPSGVTTSTALIRLTSVLLERISTIDVTNEELDSYYTLVVYFNALKELGKFRTFLTDDIVAYRKLIANHFNSFIKPYNHSTFCELSSAMSADDITIGLDRLEKSTLPKGLDNSTILVKKLFEAGIRTGVDFITAKGTKWNSFLSKSFFEQVGLTFSGDSEKDYRLLVETVKSLMQGQPDPIQIAPATNMISVGVDIPRLNTMIVNGQPKTTAEYIQASSRVGREGKGVVFTFLSPTKNRDRSHYEQFKAFHQAYYYHVEASSVTPFSRPALEKVLPTVLVTLTRSLFLNCSDQVFNSSNNEHVSFIELIIDQIKARANKIYEGAEYSEISKSIDIIKLEYFERLNNLNGDRRLANYSDYMTFDQSSGQPRTQIKNPRAVYNAPSQFVDSLLPFHIPTMQTLRNVESSSRIRIKSI